MNNNNSVNANKDYNTLYKKTLDVVGNEISNFEQIALLIHCILLLNGLKSKESNILVHPDWNKEYGYGIFEYVLNTNNNVKVKITIKSDEDLIIINGIAVYNNEKNNINTSFSITNEKFKKIDLNNLNNTITEFESFIKKNVLESIIEMDKNQQNYKSNYYISGNIYNNPNSSNFPRYNPSNTSNDPNPYFSSGGIPGGNLVGPNSNIFGGIGNSNSNNPIKYDPIGPFGTFGGPDYPEFPTMPGSNTDPFSGDRIIFGKQINNKKGPFGGGFGGGNLGGGNLGGGNLGPF
jgi:hypothetical protein